MKWGKYLEYLISNSFLLVISHLWVSCSMELFTHKSDSIVTLLQMLFLCNFQLTKFLSNVSNTLLTVGCWALSSISSMLSLSTLVWRKMSSQPLATLIIDSLPVQGAHHKILKYFYLVLKCKIIVHYL